MSGDEHATPTDPPDSAAADTAVDAVQALGQQARSAAQSALDTGKAMATLLHADLALAGAASVRALILIGVALVLGGSCWLLLMAALVALLQLSGMSWLLALLLAAALSLAGSSIAGWLEVRYFKCADLAASRRQLAKLGLITLKEGA